MRKLLLKLITPEQIVFEGEVEQVSIPTTEGEITVLPGHIALVALLAKGDVVAVIDGEHEPFIALDGFVRIKDNEVTILAESAEHVDRVATQEAIQAAQDRARELQKQYENNEVVDFEHFEAELERSLTRVRIGDKWRIRRGRGV